MQFVSICVLYFGLIVISSCTEEKEIVTTDYMSQNIITGDSVGTFELINVTTHDTLRSSDVKSGGPLKVVIAHNEDDLKLRFIPADKFISSAFNTRFSLHNNIEEKDKNEHVYTIQDTQTGDYVIAMEAVLLQQSQSSDNQEQTMGQTSASFVLRIE